MLRIDAPELEYVAVPVTESGGDVTLPQAEAAELLRDIEQLAKPRRFCSLRSALADILKNPGDALLCSARLDSEPPPLQRQLGAFEAIGTEATGHQAIGVERGDAVAFTQGESIAKGGVAGEQHAVGR